MSEDKKIINDNEEIKTESTTNEESVNNDVVIEEVAENNNGESEEIVQSEEVAEKGIKTKIKKLKNGKNTKSIIAMAVVGCLCLGVGFTYGKSVGRTLPATSRKYSANKVIATVGDTKITGEQLRQKMEPLFYINAKTKMTDEEIDANEASFIDYMTTTEVLYLEGKAEGIKVEKEDIENEYSTLMSSLQQTYNITEDELINKCNITKEDIEKELEKELLDLGLQKVTLTDHCYIYGLIPATPGYEDKKAVGFISHMDTAPDFSGENVKPQIIPDYNGEDVILKGTGDVLKTSDFPELKTLKGRTLITTDGTTLLGADDKAGVAEIMTAAEQLISSDIPHGDIWIGFTPDEEVGRGADLFDLDYFKADFAYTVDGDYEGEVAYENFNAASAVFAVKGVNVHPGEAKDIMVNAALVACEIQSQLPPMETPAHTEGREGFYHLTDMSGDVAAATLSYIIRDHDKVMFETRQKKMQEIADSMNQKYGVGTVTLTIHDSYANMLEIIEKNTYVVDIAKKAISSVGLEPISRPVRGGTDGARLSFMGLPCPNLGTGGYGFHGPFEHISVEGMETAVAVIKEIVRITAEL